MLGIFARMLFTSALTMSTQCRQAADSQATLAARFTTQDGTAKAGTDYEHVDGEVTFPPGTERATASVAVYSRPDAGRNESFTVQLHEAAEGIALQPSQVCCGVAPEAADGVTLLAATVSAGNCLALLCPGIARQTSADEIATRTVVCNQHTAQSHVCRQKSESWTQMVLATSCLRGMWSGCRTQQRKQGSTLCARAAAQAPSRCTGFCKVAQRSLVRTAAWALDAGRLQLVKTGVHTAIAHDAGTHVDNLRCPAPAASLLIMWWPRTAWGWQQQ